mmetsp:Transcript_49491/g.112340  ORF Transcript_49491/g.112340 Transcript_49491/m.112340 type:complete len:269 (+) Transcript_49491:1002-1808(+)
MCGRCVLQNSCASPVGSCPGECLKTWLAPLLASTATSSSKLLAPLGTKLKTESGSLQAALSLSASSRSPAFFSRPLATACSSEARHVSASPPPTLAAQKASTSSRASEPARCSKRARVPSVFTTTSKARSTSAPNPDVPPDPFDDVAAALAVAAGSSWLWRGASASGSSTPTPCSSPTPPQSDEAGAGGVIESSMRLSAARPTVALQSAERGHGGLVQLASRSWQKSPTSSSSDDPATWVNVSPRSINEKSESADVSTWAIAKRRAAA